MDEQKAELVKVDDRRAASSMVREERTPDADPNSTGSLVRLAMERGMDVAMIKELLQLRREEDADQARRAFVADLAAFAAECPTVQKDRHVTFNRVDYHHATIGNVIETIGPVLARHGFSWAFVPEQPDKGMMTVTTELTHRLGHSRQIKLTAAVAGADKDNRMNPLQQLCSATTYLSRYGFLMACGQATRDQTDDDGKCGGEDRRSGGVQANASDLPQKAADTIAAFAKALGDKARGDLERWVECEAPQWGADQYKGLRELWVLLFGDTKKGIEPKLDETMAKIEAMRAEVANVSE